MGNVLSKLYYADYTETSDCLNQNNQYIRLSNIILEMNNIINGITSLQEQHC